MLLVVCSCRETQPQVRTGAGPARPLREINLVLADHDEALLAIAGVVGVYVGLDQDGRSPCLRVMLAYDTPALRNQLPSELEGYPVRFEVSGPIRPLDKPDRAK